MKPKEDLINETLNSLNGFNRVEVSSILEEKIKERWSVQKGRVIAMSPAVKWIAAASIILLVGVNFISIKLFLKSDQKTQTVSNPVYSEYFSFADNIK